MHRNMLQSAVYTALLSSLTVALTACGGGGGGGGDSSSVNAPVPPQVNMPLAVSDASSNNWALIGVKVLSIALVPQGGGSNVTVWSAPTPAPYINLEQLDDIGELIGNVSVPAGTYTGAVLTVSANPGDVLLTVSENPDLGFPVAAGTSIPPAQIQIQNPQGSSGNLTVPVDVNFASPFVVSTTAVSALDLEFDLANPAFIVGHTPPAAMGNTLWAVNFKGPVRHHPIYDIARLVLRHSYGTVTSVASDFSSFTMNKDFPVLPITTSEKAIESTVALQIQADTSIGTIFYDVDANTATVVKNFQTEAPTLVNKYVRVAARYQEDGTLVAVRVWASTNFDNVWLSPEGHVAHVDVANSTIYVANELGTSVPVTVNGNTEFFYRTPANAQADATPIAVGTAFLSSEDLVRGFKVHVSAVDPLGVPLVAQTIDIENATYSGVISNAGASGLTYTRDFARVTDDYSLALNYISSSTANGSDGQGNPITGFKWWNFTFPTLVMSGSAEITAFANTTDGAVNFGGSVGAVNAWGVSSAMWADPADTSGWALRNAVLMPTPIPLGSVTSAFAGSSFAMSVTGGTMPVTVDVSTAMQSATLVYEIDRNGNIVTVMPIDMTSASGQQTVTSNLIAGVPVKVYGVPQVDGTLKAYVIVYYTGMMPGE